MKLAHIEYAVYERKGYQQCVMIGTAIEVARLLGVEEREIKKGNEQYKIKKIKFRD